VAVRGWCRHERWSGLWCRAARGVVGGRHWRWWSAVNEEEDDDVAGEKKEQRDDGPMVVSSHTTEGM
jgi:hypothetical protein